MCPLPAPYDTLADSADSADAWTDRRAIEQAHRAHRARRAGTRRRLVDPTTCERDYSEAEREFLLSMQAYKQASGRMFPTWSEVLEVLRGLGYEKPGATAEAV
jgi:hypothetical protein